MDGVVMRYNKILCVLFLLISGNSLHSFSSLSQARAYADSHPEYPKPENNDFIKPDYPLFFKSQAPTFFRTFRSYLSFNPKSWSLSSLEETIKEVNAHRTRENYPSRFVQGILAKPGTRFILIGDIEGAFHSLVRDLEQLKTMNIIDEQFKVIDPNCYLVFIGDIVFRSAYMLETLDLVASLLKVNSSHVICLQGVATDKEGWSYRGLERQVYFYTHGNQFTDISLFEQLKTFFHSLPLALYIALEQEPKTNVIRISSYGRANAELKENNFGTFFKDLSSNLSVWDLSRIESTPEKVHVQALIKSVDRGVIYTPSNGLDKLRNEGGADAWAVFSSPTLSHQTLHDFFYDAFVILTAGKTISESTLTLYHRDVRTENPFTVAQTISLRTPTEQNIVIGSTLDLSKSVANLSTHLVEGITVAINEINKKGGIHNKQLQAIVLDDEYMIEKTANNITTLRNDYGIDKFILLTGSSHIFNVIDLIRKGEILLAFPLPGSTRLRAPDLIGIVHFRCSYATEAATLVDYIVKTHKTKKFAFFYQDDDYGLIPLQAAKDALHKHGITNIVDIPYPRNASDFSKQVALFKNSDIDSLGFFSVSIPTREFIYQLGVDSLLNIKMFGISPLADNSFTRFLRSIGLKMVFSQVVPSPAHSTLEIVQEYRKVMDEHNLAYNTFSLEGYITTSLLADMMSKVSAPPTKDKLIEYIPTIKNYKYKGLLLNFNPETRALADNVWLDIGQEKPWIHIEHGSTP
jgi:branched-chain amino acid transport system substrate-binding protein